MGSQVGCSILQKKIPGSFRAVVSSEGLPADYRTPWVLWMVALVCRAGAALWWGDLLWADSVFYRQVADALEKGDFTNAFASLGLNLYPVILMWLDRLGDWVGADWTLMGKWWSVLLSSLAVLPLYGWVRRLFNDRIAFWAGLFFAIHPHLVGHSPLIIRDPTYWFLFNLALYLSWRAVAEADWRLFLGAGIAIGLAMYTRIEGILLGAVVLGWAFWRASLVREARWRVVFGTLLAVAVIPAGVVAVNLTWLRQHPRWEWGRLPLLQRIWKWTIHHVENIFTSETNTSLPFSPGSTGENRGGSHNSEGSHGLTSPTTWDRIPGKVAFEALHPSLLSRPLVALRPLSYQPSPRLQPFWRDTRSSTNLLLPTPCPIPQIRRCILPISAKPRFAQTPMFTIPMSASSPLSAKPQSVQISKVSPNLSTPSPARSQPPIDPPKIDQVEKVSEWIQARRVALRLIKALSYPYALLIAVGLLGGWRILLRADQLVLFAHNLLLFLATWAYQSLSSGIDFRYFFPLLITGFPYAAIGFERLRKALCQAGSAGGSCELRHPARWIPLAGGIFLLVGLGLFDVQPTATKLMRQQTLLGQWICQYRGPGSKIFCPESAAILLAYHAQAECRSWPRLAKPDSHAVRQFLSHYSPDVVVLWDDPIYPDRRWIEVVIELCPAFGYQKVPAEQLPEPARHCQIWIQPKQPFLSEGLPSTPPSKNVKSQPNLQMP